jgi:hypothetical protein
MHGKRRSTGAAQPNSLDPRQPIDHWDGSPDACEEGEAAGYWCWSDSGQDDPAEGASGVALEPRSSWTGDAMTDCGSAFLNRPRCGLSIRRKVSWLAVKYRPRCMAHARTPLELFSSTLSAAVLYPEGAVQNPGHQGVTTTISARSG